MESDEQFGGDRLVLTRWQLRRAVGEPPIRGDVRVREGEPPRTAVVICHGFKGFKDWAFFPILARRLAEQGHAAVSFNLSRSGVGGDDIDFSALDLFAEQNHTRNVSEIRAVLDAVRGGQVLPAAVERIGLFGHSRGGGEAVLAAAEDGRVDSLVTWSAIAKVDRWSEAQVDAWEKGERVWIPNARTGQQMPIASQYWQDILANRERLDILQAASVIDSPWLLVHGEEDETVPVQEGERIHAAAGAQAELVQIAGAGHTFGASHPCESVSPELEAALQVTTDWYDTHLPGA